MGHKLKNDLVLNFYLWAEMEYLQEMIKLPLKWKKVNFRITASSYQPGEHPNGRIQSIQLNAYDDELVGNIMYEAE